MYRKIDSGLSSIQQVCQAESLNSSAGQSLFPRKVSRPLPAGMRILRETCRMPRLAPRDMGMAERGAEAEESRVEPEASWARRPGPAGMTGSTGWRSERKFSEGRGVEEDAWDRRAEEGRESMAAGETGRPLVVVGGAERRGVAAIMVDVDVDVPRRTGVVVDSDRRGVQSSGAGACE